MARKNLLLLVPCLLVLVAWVPSVFRAGFALDDREVLFGNPVVEADLPLSSAFDRDYWHHREDAGHFRPSATLSLRFDRGLHGESAAGYHATNVALHLLACALAAWCLTALARRFDWTGPWPWFGLALFAVHPVLADSVAWISGRTSMLAAIGGLLGARAVLASRGAVTAALASAGGLVLALFGKEDGVVFGLLYLLLVSKPRERVAVSIGCSLAVAAYGFLRFRALGQILPEAPSAPLAGAPLFERLEVGGQALIEGVRLLVLPLGYSPHYRVEDLAFADEGSFLALAGVVGAWIFWGVCASAPLLFRKREGWHRAAILSCSLAAFSVLPVLQLVPAGEVFAPRFLYPVLLFGMVFFDDAIRRVTASDRSARLLRVLVLGLLVVAAWQRSGVYASRGSFRNAILAEHPDDSRSWNGLGHHYYEEGQVELAREAWRRALRIDSNYSRPWTNLGISFFQEGKHEDALACFDQAVNTGPKNPIAHVWAARARLEQSDYEAALDGFVRACELAPGLAPAWRGRARAEFQLEDLQAALRSIDRALALAPRSRSSRSLRDRILAAME